MIASRIHKKSLILASIWLSCTSVKTTHAKRFPDFGKSPPTDWTLPTFYLSQNYPPILLEKTYLPWEAIERGKHIPDYLTLERLAQVLEVPVPYFYTTDDELVEWIKCFPKMEKDKRVKVVSNANMS